MKSKFLKIAGVKSDKAFYKKYPTEAAFFKAHPEAKKEIKKAQYGTSAMLSFAQSMQNLPDMQTMMQGQMQSPGVNAGMFPSGNQPQTSGPMNAPGSYNSWDIDNNGINDIMQGPQNNPLNSEPIDYNKQYMNMSLADEKLQPPTQDSNTDVMKGSMDIFGKLIGAGKARKKQKEILNKARTWANVSNVVKDAAISNAYAEKPKNTWIRPDDPNQIFNTSQLTNAKGVGTNPLARNGIRLQNGGNATEIQNTYAPEYEPLYNIDQQKSYAYGGEVPSAQWGAFSKGMQGFGDSSYSGISSAMFDNNFGSQAGSAIGSIAGPFGSLAGGMLGGFLDNDGKNTKAANQRMMGNLNFAAGLDQTLGIHNQLGSIGVAENGGYMNTEYNPQVITMFGDHNDQDFADYANKDQYRAGGHIRGGYRQPNERAFNQSAENGTALDGSLEPMWGGTIKDVSYNPYIGNMAMGFGNDHSESDGNGNTGIGMKVLDDGGEVTGEVEIETKEPMINTGDSVTVLGARSIPKQLKLDLNIKKGNSFKKAGEEIGKKDNKINKQKEKLVEEYSNINPLTSFDQLKAKGIEAMIKGLENQQKINADRLMGLSSYQNNSEEVSKSLGYEDVNKFDKDLAKGKINQSSIMKNAKFGTSVPKAQYGLETWEGNKTGLGKKTASEFTLDQWNQVAKKYGFKGQGNKEFQQFLMSHPETSKIIKTRHDMLYGKDNPKIDYYDSRLGRGYAAAELLDLPAAATIPKDDSKITKIDNTDASFETKNYKRDPILDGIGQALGFIRPSDQEPIDPRQFAPEMVGIAQNRLEPVNMQQIQNSYLDDVTDISYQDVLNENDSDYITGLRGARNQSLLPMLQAQKYAANSKVLGEQFRANQGMKDKVYSNNRARLYETQFKNMGLAAEQAKNQSIALSNTKATSQGIANSLAAKNLQHDALNKKLGVYENMYNYRFDNQGRAINMNSPFQANIPYIYGNDGKPTHKIVYDKDGKTIKGYQPIKREQQYMNVPYMTPPFNPNTDINLDVEEEEYSPIDENDIMYQEKNGGKIKKKKYSQGSLVRAFK